MAYQQIIVEINSWLNEAANEIRRNLGQHLAISQKSDRTDLVTNMDEKIQKLLIDRIRKKYPDDKILAEENGCSTVASMQGRVWIIDPIDGTMNFVMEQENFCIMLALFYDGIGQLGFIYDVMNNELFWGGKNIGVYKNEEKVSRPKNKALQQGLLGMNAYMYGSNRYHAREIGQASMGIRVSGCAGLEFIAMIKGNHIGYLSNLSPWDYGAGVVLIEELGFIYSTIEGKALTFSGREYFLAATAQAYEDIQGNYL